MSRKCDHAGERIERLEKSIDQAIATAPIEIRAVVEALQSLRGVAKMTAVTIVAEIGSLEPIRECSTVDGL